MAERTHKQQPAQRRDDEVVEEPAPATNEAGEKLKAELDDRPDLVHRLLDDFRLKAELDGQADLVDRLLDGVPAASEAEDPSPCPLTARELEILALVAEGLSNRSIAEQLDLSEQTVKNHVAAAMHKLGAATRTRAVMSAIRNEWLPNPVGADVEAVAT